MDGGASQDGGPPPKKIRTITTGLRSIVERLQWKIDNFAPIQRIPSLLDAQKFTVELGTELGVPSKWEFSIGKEICEEQNPDAAATVQEWLQVTKKVVELPDRMESILTTCFVGIKNGDQRTVFRGDDQAKSSMLNRRSTLMTALRLGKESELPLVDGALLIDIIVTTFANGPVTVDLDESSVMDNMKGIVGEKMSTDFTGMLMETSGAETYSDIKIISADGRIFKVHKSILSARSSYFRGKLAAKMGLIGSFHAKALSGKATELVLKYIYGGGNIEESWFEDDVIVELIYAADKFQLKEVLHYLDKVLGKKGQGKNAGALLAWAQKLGLKNAEKELVAYVKKEAVTKAKSYDDLVAIFSPHGKGLP